MCAVDQPVAMASVGLTQKPSQEKHCWLWVSRWSRSRCTVHLSPLAHHGMSKPNRHFGEGSFLDTLPLYGLMTKRREEVSSRGLVYHVLSLLLLACHLPQPTTQKISSLVCPSPSFLLPSTSITKLSLTRWKAAPPGSSPWNFL